MSMTAGGQIVFDRILKEHGGEVGPALADLSCRFAEIALQLDRADRLRSYAYAREAQPTAGEIDDVPAAITDDWIETGRGGDS